MVGEAHISVFFNAWQFEDAKQTWAGLASQISGEMEKSLGWLSRQLLKLQYAWNERKTELVLNILMPVAVAGLVAALIILGFFRHVIPPEDTPLPKIVQISFYLPETDERTRQGYLDTLFSATARLDFLTRSKPDKGSAGPKQEQVSAAAGSLRYDLAGVLKIVPVQLKEAEDTADELQTFRDYSDFLDDNPREIKRLINIHRLIKILLQKHDTSWPGERQRKLVKWLIFCDTWPELVDDIVDKKEHSQSLNCLGDLAASLEELVKHPRSTRSLPPFDRLSEFAHFRQDQDALTGKDIDEGFRLAAYLSQLVRKSPALPKEVPETRRDGVPAANAKDANQRPPASAGQVQTPRAGLDQ